MLKRKIILAVSLVSLLEAQNLKTTISETLSTNPIVQERLKNYNATKEDVEIANADYYPKVDLSLGFGKEKGTTAQDVDFDFSVYQNSLSATLNVFKGFETQSRVAQQKNRSASAAYSYVEKVNDTSYKVVNAYLQVMKNVELLKNQQDNININTEIFTKVQKLYNAGLTTLSEVNKIESSLSLAKSNFVVQENTLLDSQYNLQKLIGKKLDPMELEKPTFTASLPNSLEEATLAAMQNNPSLLVSKHNIKTAQASYQEKKSPFYPSIDLEISQAMNKNLSGIEGKYDNLRGMAYLKYNLFNGFADRAALQKSISTLAQEEENRNELRRQVIEGLGLSWAANEKLTEQLKHLEEYKKFSLKTLTLYSKEYDLGRRSLLDLLAAQNDFIGSKTQTINSEYNMLFAKYRILDAIGSLVPTLMGESETTYSKVGIGEKKDEPKDTLPTSYDKDNDLITNDKDICPNSLNAEVKGKYGCKEQMDGVVQIERYGEFTFDIDSSKLTESTAARVDNLIKQLESYGWANLSFELLGNIAESDDEDEKNKKSQEKKLELSTQMAQSIKDRLVQAGALEKNITITALGDSAPIMSTEEKETLAKNNRVDIIVKKLNK